MRGIAAVPKPIVMDGEQASVGDGRGGDRRDVLTVAGSADKYSPSGNFRVSVQTKGDDIQPVRSAIPEGFIKQFKVNIGVSVVGCDYLIPHGKKCRRVIDHSVVVAGASPNANNNFHPHAGRLVYDASVTRPPGTQHGLRIYGNSHRVGPHTLKGAQDYASHRPDGCVAVANGQSAQQQRAVLE